MCFLGVDGNENKAKKNLIKVNVEHFFLLGGHIHDFK